MSYKCTVIRLEGYDLDKQVYAGSCDNQAEEEMFTIDLEPLNEAWKVPNLLLVGNYICREHLEQTDEI